MKRHIKKYILASCCAIAPIAVGLTAIAFALLGSGVQVHNIPDKSFIVLAILIVFMGGVFNWCAIYYSLYKCFDDDLF